MEIKPKLVNLTRNFVKRFLPILFVGNLIVIATGSAELNSTPSAILESTPQAQTNTGDIFGVAQVQSNDKLKLDATGTIVADELVVKFRNDTAVEEKQKSIKESEALEIAEQEFSKVKLLKVPEDKRLKIMEKLQNNPNVEYVHENHIGASSGMGGGGGGGGGTTAIANDPFYSLQSNLSRINLPVLWNSYKGSNNIKIAVLDSGVDYNLAEFGLVGNGGRIIKGWNSTGVNNDNIMDDEGHGTRVTSILGAKTNNGFQIAGVNWNSNIYVGKITNNAGQTTSFWMADGIYRAVNLTTTIKVLNISTYISTSDSTLLDAINYAQNSRGVLIVAGTKNGGDNNTIGNPFCHEGYPAAYSGVIAVVSVDENGNFHSGCTQGNGTVVAGYGKGVYHLNRSASGGGVSNDKWGTSYAAPLVSGLASLLMQCNSNPDLVRVALITGAQDAGTAGYDLYYGYGVIDAVSAKGHLTCTQ